MICNIDHRNRFKANLYAQYDVYVRVLDKRNKLTIELELWEDRICPDLGRRAAHRLGEILSSIVSSPEGDLQTRSCQNYMV